MTVALERRFANFREGHASRSRSEVPGATRGAAQVGAERLAAELDGELVRTPRGAFVRVERRTAIIPVDRRRLATLPGQPGPDVPLICLDTETTGLATAAGTLAFLVGLGWWEGPAFRQVQLLLPDHADEPALLDELRRHLPAHAWLVTYNGRGFDWPLMEARFRMHGSPAPRHAGHLDLLPLVRRLFRHRLPDARLQTAETHLLGLARHDDVPGWEIPARYLQFLRDGEPARLLGIVRHNEEDVRSLARIVAHVDAHLADPAARPAAPAGDLAGLARTLAAHGRLEEALACLDQAVAQSSAPLPAEPVLAPTAGHRTGEDLDPWWSPRRKADFGGPPRRAEPASWQRAGHRLDAPWTPDRLAIDRARLLRRTGRYDGAELAWLELTERGGLIATRAWIEIAKLREHRRRDPEAALAATHAALRLVERSRFTGLPRPGLELDLGRRASRLRRRISRRAVPLDVPARASP